MKIVIVGAGKLGKILTKNLTEMKHNVIVIDTDSEIVESTVNEFDCIGYTGNGASLDTLKEATCQGASLLIACTSGDELNILCCLVAKKFGINQTIARVRNPEYAKQISSMSNEFGISMTVNPELDAANEILRILQFPAATKVEKIGNNKVNLIEMKLDAKSPLVGKTLMDMREKFPYKVLVCAVSGQKGVSIPRGDFVLSENDTIYLAAESHDLIELLKKLDLYKQRLKSTLLIGGGKLSYYLANALLASGVNVKIIEQNEERCEELSEALPKATIIQGDVTNHDILVEEGITSVDSVVTLTGMDETNIIISTYCKSVNVQKIITKVNNENYRGIVGGMGLDSVVAPKEISSDIIIRYVRGMENSRGSEFKTLYRLVNNQIEALEFLIPKETKYTGIPLKELKLKKNTLLACIIRENKVIIPSGKDTIEPNDSVVIIAVNSNIKDVEDILA